MDIPESFHASPYKEIFAMLSFKALDCCIGTVHKVPNTPIWCIRYQQIRDD